MAMKQVCSREKAGFSAFVLPEFYLSSPPIAFYLLERAYIARGDAALHEPPFDIRSLAAIYGILRIR